MTFEESLSIRNLEFLAKELVEGFLTGLHKSPFHGYSVEFAEYRNYFKGDSLKHVDWKLFGRTDKLFVKKFDDETNLRAHFLIDTSGSMYYGNDGVTKMDIAVQLVAGLLGLFQNQRDAFQLGFFDEQIQELTELKSTKYHFQACLGSLEKWKQEERKGAQTNLDSVLNELLPQLKSRSLVILVADGIGFNSLDRLKSTLGRFKHARHELMWIQPVFKSEELELNLPKEPINLIDLETGTSIKTVPGTDLNSIASEVLKKQSDLEELLLSFGLDHHFLDLKEEVNTLFLKILRKREQILSKK